MKHEDFRDPFEQDEEDLYPEDGDYGEEFAPYGEDYDPDDEDYDSDDEDYDPDDEDYDPDDEDYDPDDEDYDPDDEDDPPASVRKKKKNSSAAKQVLMLVGMGLGLFAVVSAITWIALTLREGRKKLNAEEDPLPQISEVQAESENTTSLTTTSLTFPTDFGTLLSEKTDQLTTLTTTDTEATTTVSTRIIPGEEEFPYFTRTYTLPDEAPPVETTTTVTAAPDPAKAQYSSYGAALKKFIREKTGADTEPMYALTDLDGDGNPELLVSGGTEADARCKAFYYQNGTLVDLKGSSGGALGTLYLSGEGSALTLTEITESETESSAVSYQLIGGRLIPQHTYHAANGTYTIDGNATTEYSYKKALDREALKPAGREIALPDKPEALTAVGDHSL